MGKLKKNLAIFITVFSFLAFIILLPSFLEINRLSNFDLLVSEKVSKLWSENLIIFFLMITEAGNVLALFALSIIILLFFVSKNLFYESFVLTFSIVTSAIFVLVLKELTKIPRLENSLIQELSFSFPSGHTAMTTVFFLAIGYLFRDRIKNISTKMVFEAFCVLMIVLVSFSRIYLGVHRPTEVVAGFLLGTFCISLSIVLGHIIVTKRGN